MRQWSVRYDSYMNVWVCVLQVKTRTHTFLSELMRRLQKLQTQTDDAVRSRHTTKLLRVSVCEILTVSKVVDCSCIQILCIIILISDVISCCDRKMKLMLLTEPHYVLSRWGIARPTLCVIMTSTRVKNKHTPLTHGILGKSTKQHDHDWHFIIINSGACVCVSAGVQVWRLCIICVVRWYRTGRVSRETLWLWLSLNHSWPAETRTGETLSRPSVCSTGETLIISSVSVSFLMWTGFSSRERAATLTVVWFMRRYEKMRPSCLHMTTKSSLKWREWMIFNHW